VDRSSASPIFSTIDYAADPATAALTATSERFSGALAIQEREVGSIKIVFLPYFGNTLMVLEPMKNNTLSTIEVGQQQCHNSVTTV
jgi:hypothetical protein